MSLPFGWVPLFHTSDRSLVEHLTFRLQEELAVPLVLGHEVSG